MPFSASGSFCVASTTLGVALPSVTALAWLAAWGALAVWLLPLWQAERPDGRRGCDEPDEAGSGC